MPVTIVCGAQFGGEGKGKITAHLATHYDVDCVIRVGGPNSGHTVDVAGQTFKLRQVPAGFVNPRVRLLIAPGALVNVSVLLGEIDLLGITPDVLGVDRNAGMIDLEDVAQERGFDLRTKIGSTLSGVGGAVARRVLRGGFRLASDEPALKPFVTSVASEVRDVLAAGRTAVIEGTQGYGLSLYHTPHYPFATSRDTTASSFAAEAHVGPRDIDQIIMAVRTFPIRVEGNSGPLSAEISWEELTARSRYPYPVEEFTTTSGRRRRVGEFDLNLVRNAVDANTPTALALHGVDYLDYRDKGATDLEALTAASRRFVSSLEDEVGIGVSFIGTGPSAHEIIDRGVAGLRRRVAKPSLGGSR